MAAYLVGQRGSLRQAGVIGASVTATHTVGVLALGIVLSVATAFTPTRLYPVLGVVSGLLVVGIGLSLLRRSLADRRRDQHSHHGADLDNAGGPEPGVHRRWSAMAGFRW